MPNPVETWKADKHGLDVWPDVLRHAEVGTPMKEIDKTDLERMKWHGFFYRKRDTPGRYMNRIRITGCELTAAQARQIAFLAYEFGHGIVDVTTRGNLQVQGLEIDNVPEAAARLENVGLTSKQTGHDNIRNVFGHPFSGLMPDELFDTRKLCRAVTDLFVDSREYSDLPRKFNICLNGTERHTAHYWTQDISFLACRHEGEVLFQALVGGTQGQNPHLAWHLPVLVRPEQVVDVARTLLDLFRKRGSREKRNRGRFRYLIEEIGIGGVLDYLEEHLDFPLLPCVHEPAPAGQYEELVGWFPQRDPKLWTMGLSVPLGRLTWQQLEGMAVLARKWGSGALRTTHEQGLAVVGIPDGFREAAATDAAALGLSVHADSLARSTMACTGNQFCNIAVTATKGHMFQLIEKLRQRTLALHGIRIHMSGCPSSCAQHHTADIGLKGVRVRRLLGTREGFDVYLGGGIAGRVHMGLPYKLGVDVDQLPQLIEEIVQEYYLRHKPGQTFSAYWRERLRERAASKVEEEDYKPPTWVCERCDHHHVGEDPPVFCPGCAGLRRFFARLDDAEREKDGAEGEHESSGERTDGFVFAAQWNSLAHGEGLTVEAGGRDLALFKVGDEIHCTDSECPHEGAPLGEGEIDDNGVVTCPWHGWTFNACTGCSLDPPDNDLGHYETKIENGNIYVKLAGDSANAAQADGPAAGAAQTSTRSKTSKPVTTTLPVAEVIRESPDVRTFRLDNSAGGIPLDYPGRFVKICVPVDGRDVWRSFTVSSAPTSAHALELTIKRNPAGVVTNYVFENVEAGDSLRLKGPNGGFYFDPEKHTEPLVLISAGSGVTPMMSIARFLAHTGSELPCTFLYGARTQADIIFHEQCRSLAENVPNLSYHVSLSQPGENWEGLRGRLDPEQAGQLIEDVAQCRYFLCGPNAFMDTFHQWLQKTGVPADRIHTEQFHSTKTTVMT